VGPRFPAKEHDKRVSHQKAGRRLDKRRRAALAAQDHRPSNRIPETSGRSPVRSLLLGQPPAPWGLPNRHYAPSGAHHARCHCCLDAAHSLAMVASPSTQVCVVRVWSLACSPLPCTVPCTGLLCGTHSNTIHRPIARVGVSHKLPCLNEHEFDLGVPACPAHCGPHVLDWAGSDLFPLLTLSFTGNQLPLPLSK